MSVITSYSLTAVDENGKTVDLVEKLKANGTFTEIGRRTGHDGNPVIGGTVDLDKMNHAGWQEDLKKITDRGYLLMGTVDDKFCRDDYMKHFMDKPDIPEDRRMNGFGEQNGKLGYFTRNENYDANSIQFTAFSDEKVKEIQAGTEQVKAMWKPDPKSADWMRRDYNQKEIESISNPDVSIHNNEMHYSRNYDPYCDYIGYHTAASMQGCISRFTACTEIHHDYTCYWKGDGENTKACTPDGKDFSTAFDVTPKQLPKDFTPGKPYDKDVKILMYMGEDRKSSAIYVKPDRIHPSDGGYGKADVYLDNKDYTVYSLSDKTKSTMSPKDIVDAKNAASQSYRKDLMNKGNVAKFAGDSKDSDDKQAGEFIELGN